MANSKAVTPAKTPDKAPLIPNLEGSVAKSLFLGNILEENLFPYPKIRPEEAETLKIIIDSIDKFMQPMKEDFRNYDKLGEQPADYVNQLRELGLFGVIIPEDHQGLGLSNTAYSRILQQTSRYDGSTSLTIGAHSSIGMKGLLLFGTPEQKAKYLPKLASGEWIAAFCLTEPGAGSDAASIKTAAEKQPDGSWILNGEKLWITNGPIASFYTVFARTSTEAGKISGFLVERSWDGISTGPKEDKMGIRASATSTVNFQNVRVPAANLLGEEGQGFKIAMAILNNGRTGLGGGCVGGMKECILHAVRQARDRKQFGRPIAEFGLVKEKLAQMTVNCFAAESVVNMVAHYIDSGFKDYSVEAAISKVFASEALWQSANEGLQIAGGNGFMREFPYERMVRDSRINMIFEGTNEILRLYIGLSGMKDAGEYLANIKKGVARIFNEPIKGFGYLSGYVSKKVTHLTSLGRDRVISIHPALAEEGGIFETYTVRLSQAVEAALIKFGKKIIEQQFVTKRIGDVVIDLFVGLTVLSRVTAMIEEKGAENCETEIRLARIFSQQAKHRMHTSILRMINNSDADLEKLADKIGELDGYHWDIL